MVGGDPGEREDVEGQFVGVQLRGERRHHGGRVDGRGGEIERERPRGRAVSKRDDEGLRDAERVALRRDGRHDACGVGGERAALDARGERRAARGAPRLPHPRELRRAVVEGWQPEALGEAEPERLPGLTRRESVEEDERLRPLGLLQREGRVPL